MKKLTICLALSFVLYGGIGTDVLPDYFHISSFAEATVVPVEGGYGYKVDIDDSSVYIRGHGHVNVVITPYYARWNPSYPVEAIWNDNGYVVYRLDKNGNRKIYKGESSFAKESDDFARAIVGYLATHYET